MVMKQLLEKCSELEGIQTVDHGEYAELKYRRGHDNGCMVFVPAFPGVTLLLLKSNREAGPRRICLGCCRQTEGLLLLITAFRADASFISIMTAMYMILGSKALKLSSLLSH